MTDNPRALAAAGARELAGALRSPESVVSTVSARAAHTLCHGLAGTALLHACLGDANTAADHWNAASRMLGSAPSDGIHTGPGALATSLIIGTAHFPAGSAHHALVPRATTWLSARAQALAHHRQTGSTPWTPWAVYDVIKGLSGIGRILLAAYSTGHEAEAAVGLRVALSTLTEMILTDQGTRPGWWLPAHAHPPTVRIPPSGAATTGMAHGIAGPLAFLALAQLAGHTVPGQHDAIANAVHWLLTRADPGPFWPPHISGTDLDTGPTSTSDTTPGRRTAWCYGTPGIVIALIHAGRALGNPTLLHTAATALTLLVGHPDRWDIEGSGLCHGTAGLLQVTTRCSPHLAHVTARAALTVPPDACGFLNGAAGTALALADYAGLLVHPDSAAWDAILLVS
ncbi:lanthionine synthetase LanC family protein [Streptomyces sp. ST2-7A]|uniref:lanthionine synthetase LanC family protein n=1 Tax=Streptomyces sp. ST2-7A TaxID=2907214 RepID=UPI001F2A5052|nr:lanthionine synthetase LanC family protein [Streptomyces sp. ST2-7A]MCE7081364.1 hypothetical protein [Streptomyces sp. ST2-7A]